MQSVLSSNGDGENNNQAVNPLAPGANRRSSDDEDVVRGGHIHAADSEEERR
jgi:hypothetical protein